jgi:RNA polymerase sigma factor (TIGR02999 family)
MASDPPTFTLLLNHTDTDRAPELFPLIYDQLRAAAQVHLAAERPDHTLSATALVHEAYLKLCGPRHLPWQNRAHFYVAAAESMRRILLDHARARARIKRGGNDTRLADVRDLAALAASDSHEILRFDDQFRRLECEFPDAAAVVRLRFYAGLSVEETSEALGLSVSTVDRRWSFARAWLYRRLLE